MTISKSEKIIVIVGPTASGKSDLGIKIAKKHNGEIISADSRQVYRGMDIGTDKILRDKTLPIPNLKFKNQNTKFKNKDFYSEGIRHHLIDVVSPKKQFTADDFKKLGEKAIVDIISRHKLPIIVGGTGFYIDILLGRMAVAQVPPNPKLRAQFDKLTAEKLFEKLQKLDPQRAKVIDRHNKRRLIRALEIVYAQSQKVSLNLAYAKFRDTKNYQIVWLGINPGKEKLAEKIKKRLDERLKLGVIKEVEKLHKQGVSWKQLDDFGLEYRQISEYLKNSKSQAPNHKQVPNSKSQIQSFKESGHYQELLREIIKYSKRQMTWFKRNKEIYWIKNQKETKKLVKSFILFCVRTHTI